MSSVQLLGLYFLGFASPFILFYALSKMDDWASERRYRKNCPDCHTCSLHTK